MQSEPVDREPVSADAIQPMRDGDTSIELDPERDPAQREWDLTTAIDEGREPDDVATATGDDPAHLPADDDDIPASDVHPSGAQPDTQGTDPLDAELGEDGQGDLAPEDL